MTASALVGGVTVIGLLLRLRSMDNALFADELSTYYTVTGHGVGRLLQIIGTGQEVNPPLYFLLAWMTEKFGDRGESLRLVSLLAGTAAIPSTYLLGLRTVGRSAAVVGAALVATTPFLIFYSSEARAYSLMLLLCLLSTLALLRALDSARWRWWMAYAGCSCAALYTHYTAAFLLLAQALWALRTAVPARRLLAANLAVVVGFAPWVPVFLAHSRSPGAKLINVLQPFGPHAVRVDLEHWALAHPFIALSALPGLPALALTFTGLAVATGGLVHRWRSPGVRARPSEGVSLVVVLALAGPLLAGLYSALATSLFTPRNLIASWPGLALSVGALVTASRGWVRALAVGLALVGVAIGGALMLETRYQRPDYASAARFIDGVGAPGSPAIDLPAPTPGPLTALEAALAQARGGASTRHPVLRLGQPSLADELRVRAPGGAGPYAALPVPANRVIAAQAISLAHGHEVFLVTPFSLSAARAARLLPAALPGLHVLRMTTFVGLIPVSVFVLRGEPPAG